MQAPATCDPTALLQAVDSVEEMAQAICELRLRLMPAPDSVPFTGNYRNVIRITARGRR